VIDCLHEKDEDLDNVNDDACISNEERPYRERLKFTVGEQGMYWSINDNLRKALAKLALLQEGYFCIEQVVTRITSSLCWRKLTIT
jgi:hypothetical protein